MTLRELRRERGWTQRRLARLARVSARTVCSIERGDHAPHATTRRKLLRALKLSWEDHERVFGPLGRNV